MGCSWQAKNLGPSLVKVAVEDVVVSVIVAVTDVTVAELLVAVTVVEVTVTSRQPVPRT